MSRAFLRSSTSSYSCTRFTHHMPSRMFLASICACACANSSFGMICFPCALHCLPPCQTWMCFAILLHKSYIFGSIACAQSSPHTSLGCDLTCLATLPSTLCCLASLILGLSSCTQVFIATHAL